MTRAELDDLIAINIADKTAPASLTNAEHAEVETAIADYVDTVSFEKVKKLTLSSAQILDLFTTPIEFVPAVTGKLLVPRFIFQKYTHVSSAYTSSAWRIGYNGISFGFSTVNPVITSADNAQGLTAISSSTSAVGNTYIGLPLVLGATSSNPTGGNGTLELYLTYYEITI